MTQPMTLAARSNPLAHRLVPDLAALGLLLACMGYWWLGNLAHEIFGTVFLALVARHVVVNRRWFGALRRGRYDAARSLRLGLNLMLALTMLVLLGTSLLISENLRGLLGLRGSGLLREIHWFAAYWLVVIVGLHIGLHWHLVTGIARARLPMLRNRILSACFWALALGIAILGINSTAVMGLWTRLGFDYSLTMWDFTESTLPYFAHWLAITTLYAVIAHAVIQLLALRRSPSQAS